MNDKSEKIQFWKTKIIGFLFIMIVSIMTWLSFNYYTYQRPYTDAGIFSAISNHIYHGKIVYRDVWDHKPPIIYFINLIPILGGDGSVVSIRFYERFYAMAASIALLLIVRTVYQNWFVAVFSTVIWNCVFFNPGIFQGGNLTEEYASYFTIIAIAITILPIWQNHEIHKPFYNKMLIGFSGLFFSLAAFTKEPFILSSLPWFIYLLWNRYPDRKQIIHTIISFLVGAIIPAIAIAAYLIWNNSFINWIDVITYNFVYMDNSSVDLSVIERITQHAKTFFIDIRFQSVIVFFLLFVGIISCMIPSYLKQYRYFPLVSLLSLFVDFYAATLSGYIIEHYYLHFISSLTLVCISGFSFLLFITKRLHYNKAIIPVIVVLLMVSVDFQFIRFHFDRISISASPTRIGPISQTILDHAQPKDTLWCGFGENSEYYQETRLLSPTRYIYLFAHLFEDTLLTTKQEKLEMVVEELKNDPPTFIVISPKHLPRLQEMGLTSLAEWITANYIIQYKVKEGDNLLYSKIE
jgi:hypothetical protein